jgi:hypothetical protein
MKIFHIYVRPKDKEFDIFTGRLLWLAGHVKLGKKRKKNKFVFKVLSGLF